LNIFLISPKKEIWGEGEEIFKISENNIINNELAQVNNKVINNQRRVNFP
jgi:hypothetical protein